jgi:hypothetical protein
LMRRSMIDEVVICEVGDPVLETVCDAENESLDATEALMSSECKRSDVRWQTLRAEWASSGEPGTLELVWKEEEGHGA